MFDFLSKVAKLFSDPAALGHIRSSRWPAVRKAFLVGKSCAACGGIDSLEAHHMKPFHLYPELELDPNNLLALCEKPSHSCHFTFGHFWNWSKYNEQVIADTTAWFTKVERNRM